MRDSKSHRMAQPEETEGDREHDGSMNTADREHFPCLVIVPFHVHHDIDVCAQSMRGC